MVRLSKVFTLLVAVYAAVAVPALSAAPLDAVLAAQPEAVKARYPARHPAETLAFFGLQPGMTVVEVLPGDGWYSRILAAMLGPDGKLIGADYAAAMYPKFNYYDEAFLSAKSTWATDWPQKAQAWAADDAAIEAFVLGSMPERYAGQADAVVLVRALHNLARFENDGGYLGAALRDIAQVLKPGGIVGIVQHRAPDDADEAWADGSNGYLKQDFVVATLKAAGFEFVGASDINRNPKDQPTKNDNVWRLSPNFAGVEGEDAKARMAAIGETDRMTLLFRKPAK